MSAISNMTLRDAETAFGIPRRILWLWVRCGRMHGVMIRHEWIVTETEVYRAIHSPSSRQLSYEEIYGRWRSMIARCRRDPRYHERGTRVHSEWRNFRVFCAWVLDNLGPPSPGDSLDRIKNDGHYEPGNLQWLSRSTHSRKSLIDTPYRFPRGSVLTWEHVTKIRMLHRRGQRPVRLAEQFGVSRQMISKILNNQAWVKTR